MKLIKEFKEFAVKGNMIEMAIGIIIGASFNNVINVLVKNIFLPPLSLLSDGITLDKKKIIIRAQKSNAPEVAIIGVSRTKKVLKMQGEKIKEVDILPISLSYDHRVINGADAGRFMDKLKNLIENYSE